VLESVAPKLSKKTIKVIGGGLAGSEAALILANNGFIVHIFDTKKHISGFEYYDKYCHFLTENMKYELECLGSPIISLSKKFDYEFLTYDHNFFEKVQEAVRKHPNIQIFEANIENLNQVECTIIATGHNTQREFLKELENYIGKFHVCFYNPIEIILDADSIDKTKLNFVSKNICYANLSEEEYNNVYKTIVEIEEKYEFPEDFKNEKQITIEGLASRGLFGLRNAIFRPYFDHKQRPFASLKLKLDGNLLILDEFFSAFDEEDQYEILQKIDVFKNCRVLRYSQIARKTHLLAPMCLNDKLQIKNFDTLFVCGGLCGTAGSFESLLMANYCAYSLMATLQNKKGLEFLQEKCCIGLILQNLIRKSVANFRLFNLKCDIINYEDVKDEQIEELKASSKSQIEKFKEKFYGRYF